MELIKDLGTRLINGKWVRYAIFKCSFCLQEVEKEMRSGKNSISCGCQQYSKERNQKIANTNKNHIVTEETKQKLRLANINKIVSKETKTKQSESHKGIKLTKEHKQSLSESRKGHIVTEETKQKIRLANTGKKQTEETIKQYKGELASNWQGGLSFLPYPPEFNKEIKKQVLERDNSICQNPNCVHLSEGLDCHHIDYDKQNNNSENIITLCDRCHTKTNYDREYWTEFYQNIMINRIVGCLL